MSARTAHVEWRRFVALRCLAPACDEAARSQWPAHSLFPGQPAEVWICAWDAWHPDVLWSGGDDGRLKVGERERRRVAAVAAVAAVAHSAFHRRRSAGMGRASAALAAAVGGQGHARRGRVQRAVQRAHRASGRDREVRARLVGGRADGASVDRSAQAKPTVHRPGSSSLRGCTSHDGRRPMVAPATQASSSGGNVIDATRPARPVIGAPNEPSNPCLPLHPPRCTNTAPTLPSLAIAPISPAAAPIAPAPTPHPPQPLSPMRTHHRSPPHRIFPALHPNSAPRPCALPATMARCGYGTRVARTRRCRRWTAAAACGASSGTPATRLVPCKRLRPLGH